jgi:hypothetical protein
LTQRILGIKRTEIDGCTSKNGSQETFRVSLPVTVVAELELNSVKPPPDKIEEEERVHKDNGLDGAPGHVRSARNVK